MSRFNRRDFLKLSGAGAALTFGVSPLVHSQGATSKARVVVIGGGFGGATCARYIRLGDAGIGVTLVEPDKQFVTCPFSNYVLAGWRTLASVTHGYDRLRKNHGVDVLQDLALTIDVDKRRVRLKSGKTLAYDRLVVAPGIDIQWGAIKGYSDVAATAMPHAWKAGAQTTLLRKQLQAMKNGGTFIITAPTNPFRCPPGPYERASVVAHYFRQHKPRSKILILDAKDGFSKQGLFLDGWKRLYGDMIEWVPATKGGMVTAVDTRSMTLDTELGDKHKGNVINVIPPQSAGRVALANRLADDSGWCPVGSSFESKKFAGIYIIGDASIAGDMPKSGFAAHSQAKTVANAIVAGLNGRTPAYPSYVNTCYSLLAPDYGISVANVYRVTPEGVKSVPDSGGVSPTQVDASFRADEARYAFGWYASITSDIWG